MSSLVSLRNASSASRPRFVYLARIASTEASGNSFDSSAAPASMDALVKQCEAAGEAVKQAKAAGDAADIKAKVAALVKIGA